VEAKPATPRSCDAPGDPARLEVTPSRKLMRPGERFQFRALVMDAERCAVQARPAWSIASLPAPLAGRAAVDPSGALTIGAEAGEGEFGLVASIGGKGVTVAIEVTSPDKYEALLATHGFNASGESEQAVVTTIAAGTIGGRTAIGEDAARERKNTFVAIVGALAVCLGFAALVLFRRDRRGVAPAPAAAVAPDDDAAPRDPRARSPDPRRPSVRPSGDDDLSRRRIPLGTPSAALTETPRAPQQPPKAEPRPAARPRGKICPNCGEHYPTEAMFCGKDGTHLVLLN
jgi:hypothetical protein